MGNNLSNSTSVNINKPLIDLSREIPYFNDVKPLGKGTFLKTFKCFYNNQLIIVKIYPKLIGNKKIIEEKEIEDKLITKYMDKLKHIRDTSFTFYNVYPFQKFIETSNNVYLIRQYFYNNLRDRIGTRPSLTQTEKIWITFLLLKALNECHCNDIIHGDIKLENIMLTSWNWIYLTDFACYKPTFIPDDKPIPFSHYFDTSGLRNCSIAPERFIDSKDIKDNVNNGLLTKEMDIFSLGCVIAELFLDNSSFLNLSELKKYKQNELNITEKINLIPQKTIRKLVLQMIDLDPKKRGSTIYYLKNWKQKGFPGYFDNLYYYILDLMKMDSDDKILTIRRDFQKRKNECKTKRNDNSKLSSFQSECISNNPVDLSKSTYCDTENFILNVSHSPVDTSLGTSTIFEEDEAKNVPLSPAASNSSIKERYPGMVCLLSIICASIRDVESCSIFLNAIELFVKFSDTLDDKCRLQRIVPYLISLLENPFPTVQSASIVALINVLEMVNTFPPSDIKIFPEYILPSLIPLSLSDDPIVLSCLAKYLGSFANLASQFSSASKWLTESVVLNHANQRKNEISDECKEVQYFLTLISNITNETTHRRSALMKDVQCLIIQHIHPLSHFLGDDNTIDKLIPLMLNILNSTSSWEVKCAIFNSFPNLCDFITEIPSQLCLFPHILKYLYDPNIYVINTLIKVLYKLYEYLNRKLIFHIINAIIPLLLYPNTTLCHNIANLISKLSIHSSIHYSDICSSFLPEISKFVRGSIMDCSYRNIIAHLLEPISKDVYNNAINYCSSLVSPQSDNISLRHTQQIQEIDNTLLDEYIKQSTETPQDLEKLKRMQKYIMSSSSFFPKNTMSQVYYSDQAPESFEVLQLQAKKSSQICFKIDKSKEITESQNSFLLDSSMHSLLHASNIPSSISFTTISKEYQPFAPNWIPNGNLVTTMNEHSNCVNRIIVTADNELLVSASDDKTIRLWETKNFGKTYQHAVVVKTLQSKATTLIAMQNSIGILVGQENGYLQCYRIDKYNTSFELAPVIQYELKSEIVEILNIRDYIFLILTRKGELIGIDVRNSNSLYRKQIPNHFGYITCAVNDKDYAIIGTSLGYYSCWDLRLLIETKHWRHPFKTDQTTPPIYGSIDRLCLYKNGKNIPYFFASTSNNDIYKWNTIDQTYDLVLTTDKDWAYPSISKPVLPLEISKSIIWNKKPLNEKSAHKALYSLPNSTFLLSGSVDCCIRNWDISNPNKSKVICGWLKPNRKPFYDITHDTNNNHTYTLVEEFENEIPYLPNIYKHKDCIMDIIIIRPPNSRTYLISCSRDGIINVWV